MDQLRHTTLKGKENLAVLTYYNYYDLKCEAFNGIMREHNLHSNRMASSRDVATRFAIFEQLNLLCKSKK